MQQFTFVDNDRSFACTLGPTAASRDDLWWWFTVSTEGSRFAGFRPLKGENRAAVQARVVACYTKMLEDRARPRDTRSFWQKKKDGETAAAESASQVVE
jgi:hypothetical protein